MDRPSWNRLREFAPGLRPAESLNPFDGSVHLFGTTERVFCGRWACSPIQPGNWDFLKTAHAWPSDPVFWRPVPNKDEPGWLSPGEASELGLKSIPEGKKLLIRVSYPTMWDKWLEAWYLPQTDTWHWSGQRKLDPKIKHEWVDAGFLVDAVPRVSLENRISGTENPPWA